MPLYFFDIINNGAVSRDESGLELVDFDEARDQAIVLLPDIARVELPGGDLHVFVCQVRDAWERVIYQGSLTYAGERFLPNR